MPTAYDPPEDIGSFGMGFDYSVWSPNTEVFLTNVVWDQEYRDVVWYDNYDEAFNAIVNEYSSRIEVKSLTYCAQGAPIRIPIPFSKANQYNYLVARNNRDAYNSRNTFFYFITSVDYIAPATTQITVQLDVWQTYMHQFNVRRSYCERSHMAIAAENGWDYYGQKYMTVPEGLDLGSEYQIVDVNRKVIASTPSAGKIDTANFDIIIASTVDLTQPYGDEKNPTFTASKGSFAEGVPNGTSIYAMKADWFRVFTNAMSLVPWVSQGIVSITAIPKGVINFDEIKDLKVKLPGTSGVDPKGGDTRISRQGAEVYDLEKGIGEKGLVNNKTITLTDKLRKDDILPARYRHLWKFWTSPYLLVEVTTFSGTPLLLKPEMIQSAGLAVTQWSHVVPPNPRIMFTVNSLGQRTRGHMDQYDGWSEHFDVMTGFTNLPTFSLTNNSYLMFQAQNAHSIAYQHQSAEWSQQRALHGAQTQFNQANAAIAQAGQQTALNNSWNQDIAGYNARMGLQKTGIGVGGQVIGSTLMGLANGGPLGALAGLGGSALSGASTMAQAGMTYSQQVNTARMSAEQASALTNLNQGYMRYNADTNLAYAKYAANGDYANAIAGINAKVQDAQTIAPTTSGQVGGDAFMLAAESWSIVERLKFIPEDAVRRIGEFWLRYGYAMNSPVVPPGDFRCMEHFTYWKMTEMNISRSTMPETFRQTIRGIFEKGVTVWHKDQTMIGRIDWANNKPLKGIIW